MVAELSAEEWARYARQIGPGVLSRDGQSRLASSTALVTRVGGMGGPAALALVMAGVGRVIVAHGGHLISPDLNRQVLGSEEFLGQPRAPSFAERLRSMNRFVRVEEIDHEPDDDEARRLARQVNVILSCPPTFAERLRLNNAAVEAGVPLIDAAQWGLMGTLIAVRPGQTACLRCVYPQDPPFEEEFPVLGAISSAVGALAALETIKILSRTGVPLFGRLWMIDGFRGGSSLIELTQNPECPCCGRQALQGLQNNKLDERA
jgi:molybdopterin/thiamine biosynthesis adenylyltransferase